MKKESDSPYDDLRNTLKKKKKPNKQYLHYGRLGLKAMVILTLQINLIPIIHIDCLHLLRGLVPQGCYLYLLTYNSLDCPVFLYLIVQMPLPYDNIYKKNL